ncbi:MAG: PepSY-like domain-containing protein [Bacteroidales bacterium]|nr:PepSY-like domain-containing protein [Bacteroidales bacterium]
MKNLFVISMILAVFSFSACGQKENIPVKVKTTFSQKFPNAKKVKWDKEGKSEWEAEFKMNGKEYSANFAVDGTWKETEHEIQKSEIPAIVKNTINTEFAGYKIKEAEISETVEGKVYEFELRKEKTETEVAVSPTGKVVKKESKKENDEEDND